MSPISDSSLSAQSLYQQSLRTQTNQAGATDPQAEFKSRIEAAAKAAGVDPSSIPALENQIQTAVQGALQGTAASGDKRAAVGEAIAGVLKSNGIDPAKFKTAFEPGKAAGHRHRGGHHAKAPSTSTSPTPAGISPPAFPPEQDPLSSAAQIDFSA